MSRQDSQYNERMNHSRQRELVAQRTKEELHASHKITLAYVAEIPAKSANSVLQYAESLSSLVHQLINLQSC